MREEEVVHPHGFDSPEFYMGFDKVEAAAAVAGALFEEWILSHKNLYF
jgi:hypothetical protein